MILNETFWSKARNVIWRILNVKRSPDIANMVDLMKKQVNWIVI